MIAKLAAAALYAKTIPLRLRIMWACWQRSCVEREIREFLKQPELIPRGVMFSEYMRQHDSLSTDIARMRLSLLVETEL